MKHDTKGQEKQNKQLDSVYPIFARHETFHPRFGWLKKGFDKAQSDPEVFIKDNASVVLGVGKNMVRSIRYWCSAFKVLGENQSNAKRGRVSVPSEFGMNLLSDAGWDPYLENPGSLWLLHWYMLKPPCRAATWFFVFNQFRQLEFTTDDLLMNLEEYKKQTFPSDRTVRASLNKDINCLIRMYAQQRNYKSPSEDSIDCPFAELGLILNHENSRRYFFSIGTKPSLPDEIIVAACLDYASFYEEGTRTVSISRLLYDVNSPGLAFKLTENGLCSAIENIALKIDGISLSNNAGLIQLSYNQPPKSLVKLILEMFYR